jgi:AcrR family transcriptional regulator|tara:strand:+ start:7540 stop:8256 length:717 start_codon:yes stop_codon:yes gene_type:complete
MTRKDDDVMASTINLAASAEEAGTPRKKGRTRSSKTTRENILKAAKKIFARDGYGGARVDKISKAAKSYDSLIYYYFGSKEKLFVAVLEEAYKDIFEAEKNLDLDMNDPVESLRTIIQFPFRYYIENPELIVLLNAENLNKGKHIAKSKSADQYAGPAISILRNVIEEGQKKDLFRNDVDCEHLYMAMTALGYFYISNRYTFSAFLAADLMDPKEVEHWANYISDLLMQSVLKPGLKT